MQADRGDALLGAIYDDVDRRLNPDQEECWHCGGAGEIYDCIDGCCVDPESGCPDCARSCPECRRHAATRAKMIREEVIKSGDLDVAAAWLKSVGRWREDITRDELRREMETAKAKLDDGEIRERE